MEEAQIIYPTQVQQYRGLSYQDGVDLQRATLKQIAENPDAPQQLLFCEHTPVVTLGRSGDGGHLLADAALLEQRGIEFHKAGRGGDVTYHGPGQWTVYPILRIGEFCRDLHRYMRNLEEVVITYLRYHEIESGRREGKTGVWVGRDKICAIGVAVSRWISWHGIALNINTDLTPFTSYMTPCGIVAEEGGVTSLQQFTGKSYDLPGEVPLLAKAFCEVFPMALVE